MKRRRLCVFIRLDVTAGELSNLRTTLARHTCYLTSELGLNRCTQSMYGANDFERKRSGE
jgi:hypothetical protein